jgi:hypothetical protein
MTLPTAAPDGAGNDTALNAGATEEAKAPTVITPGTAGADAASVAPRNAPQAAPADYWPADWREKLAGEDRRALEQLKRHGSPADLWKKARALEQKLSSGEYRRDLPKAATPEQLAAWRIERGVPETPDGYRIELPDGVVLGEADKPVVDAFTAAMHGKNWDNAKVNEALGWYYGEQERQLAVRAEKDAEYKQEVEAELRADFGAEFTPNLNAVKNLLASMPEGAADNFLAGRLADGRRIGDSPGVIKWLAKISRKLNPTATLIPAGSGRGGKGAADRIAEIEKLMGDHTSAYWRGPQAAPMQQEYRDLVEARDRRR